MANINIKTDFIDGEKLFAQQLNNNFKTIQEGMNADNKIIWQDGTEVLFKRFVTNDIDNLPIIDGSIIYDIEKGRHYIDYNGVRIQVGSAGKEVVVQEEKPTEEDTKLWIDTDVLNNIGTEIINSLDGNETNRAPSVKVVKEYVEEKNKDIFSLEEQRIGTWFGKPLYRKVIDFGDLPNNGDKTVAITDIDFDNIWIDEGSSYGYNSDESWGLNFYVANVWLSFWIGKKDKKIKARTTSDLSGFKAFITLNYTKTTDSEEVQYEI